MNHFQMRKEINMLIVAFFYACHLEGVQGAEIGLGNCKHVGVQTALPDSFKKAVTSLI
jgi:hypothetical protein